METIIGIVVLSIIAEYLTSVIKPLLPETQYPVPLLITLVISVTLAVACKVDLLSDVGLNSSLATLSYIVSGLAAAGGSKATHELLSKLRESRESIMPNNTAE